MSKISELIDSVISCGLSAFLKEAGFKKSARTWHKLTEEGWQVVNVQASSGNIGSSGKFTINLGFYCIAIEEMTGSTLEGKPKEYQTTIRERIGSISVGKDYWWELDENTDISSISCDVIEKMKNYGLPWLNAHSTARDISNALCDQPSLQSIASAQVCGNSEEALRRLRSALADRPAASAKFMNWAKKAGLEP